MDITNEFARLSGERWTEDLRVLAVRGVSIGRALCTCDRSYHVSWGILRAVGHTNSIKPEEATLGPLLSGLIKDGTRILIAGAADTGTLCVTGRAAGTRTPEITVLDRCRAPLRLIDDFASERGLPCRTIQADLSELDEANRWDVVLMHYTLSFIEADKHRDIVRRLARALAPGGTMVCATRTGQPVTYGDLATLCPAWFDTAWQRIETAQIPLPLTRDELKDLIQEAATASGLPKLSVSSADALKACMAQAGLLITDEAVTARRRSLQLAGANAPHVESSVIVTAARPR